MGVKLIDVDKIFQDSSHPDKQVHAVRNANIDVKDGELVTLLGPSGCGKTTTLRIVSGFEAPTKGEVWISGKMVNDQPPNMRDTSMVFQSYAIFPHLSVGQNIGFGLELKGRAKNEIKSEVEKIMEVMDLKDLARRRPDQLSGGQQQRVALARAIINQPSVLLFDEPLSNLDAKLRDQMRIEIRRIQQTFGITSIYVTHDQDEAMTVSDRIVVMNDGYIMQIGTPFEIYSRPANSFVADFIGRVNFLRGKIVAKGAEKGATSGRTSGEGLEVEFAEMYRKRIASRAGEFSPGDSVSVTVRPESLRLTSDGSGILQGKINKIVYLGPVVEYEIDTGVGKPVLAVTHNPVETGFFKLGESVGIDFSPVSAHVLPDS